MGRGEITMSCSAGGVLQRVPKTLGLALFAGKFSLLFPHVLFFCWDLG